MSEGLRLNFSRPNPIVPAQSVAGRTLMLLIGIMTFLSCVTFAACFWSRSRRWAGRPMWGAS